MHILCTTSLTFYSHTNPPYCVKVGAPNNIHHKTFQIFSLFPCAWCATVLHLTLFKNYTITAHRPPLFYVFICNGFTYVHINKANKYIYSNNGRASMSSSPTTHIFLNLLLELPRTIFSFVFPTYTQQSCFRRTRSRQKRTNISLNIYWLHRRESAAPSTDDATPPILCRSLPCARVAANIFHIYCFGKIVLCVRLSTALCGGAAASRFVECANCLRQYGGMGAGGKLFSYIHTHT